MKYTIEGIEKAIKSLDDVLIAEEKKRKLEFQLKYQLIRIKRALSDKFWYDELKTKDEKIKAFKTEKELYFNTYGKNPSWDDNIRFMSKNGDFHFHLKKQWELDRQKLIKEGSI